MVNKITGVFDVLAGLVILLNMLDVIGNVLVLAVVVYFIVRVFAFYGEPLYMVDGLIALIVLVNLLYKVEWINYIIILYLIIKGVIFILRK